MLTLTFLGVGSAFAKRNFHSNALVEVWSNGPERDPFPIDNLLIDFGGTGPLALYQLKDVKGFEYLGRGANIHYPAIRRILVTHLHSDHIGGLEELALLNRFADVNRNINPVHRPMLISDPDILENLWSQSLRGGLGVLDGRTARLEDFFQPMPVDPGARRAPDRVTLGENFELMPFAVDHIRIRTRLDWPALGLSIHDRTKNRSLVYSGDTRFDREGVCERMVQSTLNFHEVQLEPDPDPVHSLLDQLRTLPEDLRRRMWLYHYGDRWDCGEFDIVAQEFAGFARPRVRYRL